MDWRRPLLDDDHSRTEEESRQAAAAVSSTYAPPNMQPSPASPDASQPPPPLLSSLRASIGGGGETAPAASSHTVPTVDTGLYQYDFGQASNTYGTFSDSLAGPSFTTTTTTGPSASPPRSYAAAASLSSSAYSFTAINPSSCLTSYTPEEQDRISLSDPSPSPSSSSSSSSSSQPPHPLVTTHPSAVRLPLPSTPIDHASLSIEKLSSSSSSAAVEQVVIQSRLPLQRFKYSIQLGGVSTEVHIMYFQVHVIKLPVEAERTILTPSLLVGVATAPLHKHALAPGFNPPCGSFTQSFNMSLSDQGGLYINGQGPCSGVVGVHQLPFFDRRGQREVGGNQFQPRSSSSSSDSALREGDLLGFAINLTHQLVQPHLNDVMLAPINILLPEEASIDNMDFYPSVAMGRGEGEVQIRLMDPTQMGRITSSSSSAHPLQTSSGAASLCKQYLPDEDLMLQSVNLLSDRQPDLGVVLDQATQAEARTAWLQRQKRQAQAQAQLAGNGATPRSKDSASTIPPPCLLIGSLIPNGACELAGLQKGDVVTFINAQRTQKLSEAITEMRGREAGEVVQIGVEREGQPYVFKVTLGMKDKLMEDIWLTIQKAQAVRKLVEYVGPPALRLPHLPSPRSPLPSFDQVGNVALSKQHATRRMRDLMACSEVEQQMEMQRDERVLPQYATFKQRMDSFCRQAQVWRSLRLAKEADDTPTSAALSFPPPHPLDLSLHGFVYAPLPGYPSRCMCFSCGSLVYLSQVQSFQQLLEVHRQGGVSRAQQQQQQHHPPEGVLADTDFLAGSSASSGNKQTARGQGCAFLTRLDACNRKQRGEPEPEAAYQLEQATASSSSAALLPPLSSLPPSHSSVSSTPLHSPSLHAPDISIGIDVSPRDRRMRGMAAPLVSNQENLARDSSSASASPQGSRPGSAVGMNKQKLPSYLLPLPDPPQPPPEWDACERDPTIPIGAPWVPQRKLDEPFEEPADAVLYQSPYRSPWQSVRLGEFTPGAIDLPGRPPLSEEHRQARARDRSSMVRWGNDGPPRNLSGAPFPNEEHAARDALDGLRDFFLRGSKWGLLWKVPMFLIILPFFLVYALLEKMFQCTTWVVSETCAWLCDCLARSCTCFCRALVDYVLAPLCDCCQWTCDQVERLCCTPLVKCLSKVCGYICKCLGKVCDWLCVDVCSPICEALCKLCDSLCSCFSAVFSAIGRCLSSCGGHCCRALECVCDAIGDCLVWFWTPICKCVGQVCEMLGSCLAWMGHYFIVVPAKAIGSCLSAIGSALYEYILAPVGRCVWSVLSVIGSGLWSVLSVIGRGLWAVLSALGTGLFMVLSVIGSAVWAVMAAVGKAIGAVGSAVYNGVLAPIGRALKSAGRAIADICW